MAESKHLFSAHVDLLQLFLAHRVEIVEKIQVLLNAQRKPVQFLQDAPLLSRQFEDCFFTLPGARDHSRLRGQLREAHWASGFKPRESPGLHNDLVDPGEMMVRAFHLWGQTHWPGTSGRVRYGQTLFNLYVIRYLALLIMRLWDEGPQNAGDRLPQVQSLLDQLWKTSPADQPVLVRDVRWLIPVAQSPTTDELAGYFEVAKNIAETLADEDSIEIYKAGVRMAGGHLRSQLRHVSMQKGVPLDENSLVLSTRKSNALDIALLIQGLVPLLDAYKHAIDSGGSNRLEFAAAILQGISPDPELFLNRLDLLAAYSMIEHLFITDLDGHVAYTPAGQRHVQLVQKYEARIRRLSTPLYDDLHHFRPVDGAYSPCGVLFGFSSNLLELMAFKTIQADAVARFGLEDVFSNGDGEKLAWVSGWRKLPHIKPEVAKLFAYPQQFAEDIFARIELTLRKLDSPAEATTDALTARMFLLPELDLPDLPVKYILSSDKELVAAHKAEFCDQTQLLHERFEGEFVLSYKTSGGWVAISKDILTEVLGAGRRVKLVGLPRVAAEVLRLMCRHLAVLPNS